MDDPVTTAVWAGIKAFTGWTDECQYKNVGGECPECHHGPLYERHVGFVVGGHAQCSCPCRLVRQSNPGHSCRCEWSQDF